MTEQTEWRSGDVVVKAVADGWLVFPSPTALVQVVPKDLFPDGAALAEFIDSQQPKPRYCVEVEPRSGLFVVVDMTLPEGAVDRLMARSPRQLIADHLADWLNAREATDA